MWPGDAPGSVSVDVTAVARDIRAWLVLFVKTCKTCRLYGQDNVTVVRFRADLYAGLRTLLDAHGDITLHVSSRELAYEGQPVYQTVLREDSLAATFHRDGIRSITLARGIGATELNAFLDLFLHVTGQDGGDDDLVTLLWEHEIGGVEIEAQVLEAAEIEGAGEGPEPAASPMPWPAGVNEAHAAARGASGVIHAVGEGSPERSDDHELLARTVDLDEVFDELESSALHEMARLQQEHEEECAAPLLSRALQAVANALAAEATDADQIELAGALPRILRESLLTGDWRSASATFDMLRRHDASWSASAFFERLATGPSIALTRRAVAVLDEQGPVGLEQFLELATRCGEASLDWFMLVLAESTSQRTRRPLARTIATIVTPQPDRLLPWIADERWYVVRNVVHMLGLVGGDRVAGLVQAVIHHPDDRVRREIVTTLASASPEVRRPILLAMLGKAYSRLFTMIVQQVSQTADPIVARRLVEMLRDESFIERAEDERRAVYMGLANQGDAVLEDLATELERGGLFSGGLDGHRISIARCMARIGTPAARAALERGRASGRPATRKACEQAMASMESPHA